MLAGDSSPFGFFDGKATDGGNAGGGVIRIQGWALAAGGVRFTDFHSGAPSCSPSRATFLTGRQHRRTGVYSVITERLHKMHLLESETTIAEVLRENGYATAHFGKWHLGMPVHNRENPTPGDHGFDYWFGLVNGAHPSHKDPTNFLRNGKPVGKMNGYSCQIVVDEALTWLDEKRDADAPFFSDAGCLFDRSDEAFALIANVGCVDPPVA